MKTLKDIHAIAVIGAGTMGSGIAQLAATAGFNTLIYDVNDAALNNAKRLIDENLEGAVKRGKMQPEEKKETLKRIKTVNDFEAVIADIVIEAAIEKLDIKRDIFKKLETQNAHDCILATNTSSIPITQIAYGLQNPERVVGMHFFNPAHIMKLVEVISGAQTNMKIAEIINLLAEKMGKKAVMAKDSPGFIVNRVARHYYVEGLQILEENVASVEVIDELAEASGFKMGPFKLMDLIGVDTNFSVTTSIYEQFHYDSKFRPSRIQKQLVDAGYWGRKTKKGFYTY